MALLNYQHHYSSLQCLVILQKSFQYADLKKHFLLLSVLKKVVLLIVFVESVIHVFHDSLMNRNSILNVFTVTFDQFKGKVGD